MFRIIGATCLFGFLASSTAMAGQADTILVNANVLTSDPARPTAQAIALAGERIRAVGSNAEVRRLAGPKTEIVDLRGRSVIPGLMDAHVHLLIAPTIVDDPSMRGYLQVALPKVLSGFISHGITTVRSTADPLPYITELRDRLEKGEINGPRLLVTGPTPSSPGGHPAITVCENNPYCRQGIARELSNEEQARQVVRELAGAKVDAVKVTLDNNIPSVRGVPLLSDAVVAALVDETHRNGRRIIAHVQTDAAATERLAKMGFDEFVHVPLTIQTPSERSSLAGVLAGRKMVVTTTLSWWDGYKDTTGGERQVIGVPFNARSRQAFEALVETTKVFADAGVKLVVGTDWGAGFANDVRFDDARLQAGAMTLHEMELLRRAGLSTSAVLAAATRSAAEALGIIDKVGTVTEGKLADLVILDGDPLQDLTVLQRTVAVLKGGRVVSGALPTQ